MLVIIGSQTHNGFNHIFSLSFCCNLIFAFSASSQTLNLSIKLA